MSKLFALMAVMALVLGGAAFAEEAAPAPAPEPAPAAEKVSGKIDSVDADKGVVVVAGAEDKKTEVTTNADTKVTLNDKEAKVADLQKGDEVEIEVKKDGDKTVAVKIAAKRAEAAKEPPADKPADPPADKPADPPADKPADPPADKPADPPAGK